VSGRPRRARQSCTRRGHATCDRAACDFGDGIVFDVIDAMQSADGPINMGGDGPHSVLVEEQADGTLRPSQYCACCNVVGRERKGPKP
jgi:hypothetical protein